MSGAWQQSMSVKAQTNTKVKKQAYDLIDTLTTPWKDHNSSALLVNDLVDSLEDHPPCIACCYGN